MHLRNLIFSAMFFLPAMPLAAATLEERQLSGEIVAVILEHEFHAGENAELQRPNPLFRRLKSQQKKNKRLICAALAFPFPFGIVGLHRIYMGTAPYVPVVYIASIGGAFGVLPLIDFFVLLADKDLEKYINNPQVFMWVK